MAAETEPLDELTRQIADFAGSLGLNRSVGLLYARLYMSPNPLSLDDLADLCAMSKANASLNMRYLETWGAVRRLSLPGDRKDYFEANRDLPDIVIGRLKEGLGRRMDTVGRGLDGVAEKLSGQAATPEQSAFYAERLAEIRRYHTALQRVIRNMDKLYDLVKRFL